MLCVQKYLLMTKTLFSLESHILTHVSFVSEYYEIMKYVIMKLPVGLQMANFLVDLLLCRAGRRFRALLHIVSERA